MHLRALRPDVLRSGLGTGGWGELARKVGVAFGLVEPFRLTLHRENSLMRWGGSMSRGILRLRGGCARRSCHSAQDDIIL